MAKRREALERGGLFWTLADELLTQGVEEGSLMGFPCLRVSGRFLGMCDHPTGDLVVKLTAPRVQALIAGGEGEPFAPAGRTFKEWVRIVARDEARWRALLAEARALAAAD
ncbi:MAG: hypothetical protein R3F62_20925 [Planctomycetota bacterium]